MAQIDNPIDDGSLERIVPDELQAGEATGLETLRFHLERYEFASRHLVEGKVLDMACGVGYGTSLLAENPRIIKALGVDISPESVRYAGQRYRSSKISFQCSDALTFSGPEPFENVVSLETIEHLNDPGAFFARLVSLVAAGGRLIASVPVTPSIDANPHHQSNFTARRFRKMADPFPLRFVASLDQVQPYRPFAMAFRKEARASGLRRNLAVFYLKNPSHFFLRVWSIARDGFANKYTTIVWEKKDRQGQ